MKYLLIVVVLLALGIYLYRQNNSTYTPPPSLSSLQTGSIPWPPEIDHLQNRLRAINLPILQTEGVALHTHQHLDIFIDGQPVTVPADIGIGPNDSYISPIHTHDTSGFIHVESPNVQTYNLGQFFDIWGVRLTDTCLGGYCNDSAKTLSLYSNGKSVKNNFRNLTLAPHQEIVLSFGTPSNLPSPIPSSYVFPPDY